MRRALLVLLVVLIAVPSVALAVPDARLAVSGLTVGPDTPTVDEPVTVTATIRNSAGSDSPAELTEVRLVNRDGNTTLATARNVGSLSPGDTLAVDLTRQFRTAGTKRLAVVAVGEDSDGERVTVRRPVTVVVESTPPLVEVRADPVAGETSTLGVRLSNPSTESYRNLVVTVDAPGIDADRRAVALLPSGASTTLNLSYTPPAAGTDGVDVTVDYTTATGVERTVERETTVSVAPLREDVGVAVDPVRDQQVQADVSGGLGGLVGGGSGGTLQQEQGSDSGPPDALAVTVTNFGNARIEDAVVVPSTDSERLSRVAVGDVPPGESRTVEIPLDAVDEPSTVTATVEYATGGQQGSASGTFDYRPPTGEIRLTGVDVTVADGTATITGNAGNVGDGEVTGVVVRVLPAAGVRPAYPSRDYFVGTVEGSDFAPFELTAAVDSENGSAVPVEVRYRTGGETVTRTTTLPLDGVEPSDAADGDDSNPAIAGLAGVGVVLLATGAILAARRRR